MSESGDPPRRNELAMKMAKLNSTVIDCIAYSEKSRTLDVRMINGKMYRYFLVPEAIYLSFSKAISPGRFYNDRVKGFFTSTRIE